MLLGKTVKTDADFTLTDEDFDLICQRELDPEFAFIEV